MAKILLVRASTGQFYLQVDRPNQWGFSLVNKNGCESPGGLDFAPLTWKSTARPLPRWATEWAAQDQDPWD